MTRSVTPPARPRHLVAMYRRSSIAWFTTGSGGRS